MRQKKTVNGTDTNYYYNGSVLIGLTKGNNTLRFSYDAAGAVAAVDFNGTYYYYVRNGQGDIVKLIDGSRNTVVEYAYDSWGKLLSCTGTLATSLGSLNPFRYRGYGYDEETQWYYLKSRYYDPETCRFISADVLLSTGQGVLGHNCYAYCLNNPVNRSDGLGTISKEELWWIMEYYNELLQAGENASYDADTNIITVVKKYEREGVEITETNRICFYGVDDIESLHESAIYHSPVPGLIGPVADVGVSYIIDRFVAPSMTPAVTALGLFVGIIRACVSESEQLNNKILADASFQANKKGCGLIVTYTNYYFDDPRVVNVYFSHPVVEEWVR